MDELSALKQKLAETRSAEWDGLPDLGLYMDQIISYMPRQLISFAGTEPLTPAMVNNYIKDGLLPRAEGKKYSRVHLAYLTAICALKRVLSVREIQVLLGVAADDRPPEAFYGDFLAEMDTALNATAETLNPDLPEKELAHLALSLALRSYADQLACERILGLLRKEPKAKPAESRKKREQPPHKPDAHR